MERIVPRAPVTEALTAAQMAVATRVLQQEEASREHVVVYLSGAHAYGFPSPDSDLDLKAIHVARTTDLLGFEVPPPTHDRAEVIDGVEIDYTSNELAHALVGILAGNGNFLERVLGRMTVLGSPLLAELQALCTQALSQRVHKHYRGFALNQLRFLEKGPTVKKLLYVLRTATTGIHLLTTGELEPDLTRLVDRYDLEDAAALVLQKRTGERVGIDPALLEAWRPKVERLLARLDEARETSVLPEHPTNEALVREWLLSVRKTRLT